MELGASLLEVRGIGPVRSRGLAAAGFRTVEDLLFHLPFRYEDRRALTRIADLADEGTYALRGRLRGLRRLRLRRRKTLIRGELEDGSGSLQILWFNQPYLLERLSPERDYLLVGVIRRREGRLELINPSCEQAERALRGGRIVPVYGALAGLGPATLRRLFSGLLDSLDLPSGMPEPLPAELRRRHGLPEIGPALAELHRPSADADVPALNERRSAAHRRLIYGELLDLQLRIGRARRALRRRRKAHGYRVDEALRRRLHELPSFRLTGAQERVLGEILDDLAEPHPMLRLLQGDVGSGKTVVAALALVAAMESGLQGAFMAPTELLAEQHYRTLNGLLGRRYRLGLLTSSAPEAERSRKLLAGGDLQLAVGTHALIQEGVRFRRLGLAVIDEQHRFGVAQRRTLQAKGDAPDLLVMTATPIPRSLAMTAYGDLSLSVLDELPPGRRPVKTRVMPERRRAEVYAGLRRRLEAGARAYVVAPVIEESERVETTSIEAMERSVRELLPGVRLEVVHGRRAVAERERAMSDFAAGRVRVLLATTVIEVGVDVPEASVMVVEGAERFGLAQLHQLRGRVGRGRDESVCVALHGRASALARRRLEIFAATTDGFEIAEADLRIRGPGDLLGTQQAGLPPLRAADIVRDREWLERARADAREMLARELAADGRRKAAAAPPAGAPAGEASAGSGAERD